tara:strand:- start:268 stop:1134 length:867 start_codon:yes stop_codon:yes gene_type:complete
MADFPVVNFAQYQWEVNDQNYLTKWNNFQTAITAMQSSINTFGDEVEQELVDALTAAEETRQQAITDTNAIKTQVAAIRDDDVIPARTAAVNAATASEEARDKSQAWAESEAAVESGQYSSKYWAQQAEQTVTGDTPITSLQPGTLINPKDYPSTDGAGNLVVRNVDEDVAEHLLGGVEAVTFDAVDKGTVSTGTVLFDVQAATKQKLTVGGALTIALTNKPANDWELEIDLTNGGAFAITFPTVNWLVGDGTTSTVFADMGVTLNAAGANTLLFWGTGTGDVYGRAG